MSDYFLKYLQRCVGRSQVVGINKKKNSIFIAIIPMLAMGIFFCVISKNYAYADKFSDEFSRLASFEPEYVKSISELRDIDVNWEKPVVSNHCQATRETAANNEEIFLETKEELKAAKTQLLKDIVNEKIVALGQSAITIESISRQQDKVSAEQVADFRSLKILELVKGYPIEEMLPYIAARNEKTAYYLVAIAKKESDWGKHAPLKNGGTCYNFWGYRGNYKQTDSGYSCFDSPEQAIAQVGDRIESLIDKNIDTPEKLIVWKCGSTCAGHDPQGVLKWISDVKLYYRKLST